MHLLLNITIEEGNVLGVYDQDKTNLDSGLMVDLGR